MIRTLVLKQSVCSSKSVTTFYFDKTVQICYLQKLFSATRTIMINGDYGDFDHDVDPHQGLLVRP